MNKTHKLAALTLFIMLALVAAFTGCKAKEEKEAPVVLPEPTFVPTPTPAPTPTPTPTPTPAPTPTPKPPNTEPGVVGHLTIKDAGIDEVLVLGEDNEFYLNHDATGKKNYRGAVFFDCTNADVDMRKNLVLHGHNNKDGTRFKGLHDFRNEKFFNKEHEVLLTAFGNDYIYEVVYAGIIDVTEYNHTKTDFTDDDQFVRFMKVGMKKSTFVKEGFTPKTTDRLLTMSTCVNPGTTGKENKRLVVFARMVQDLGPTKTEE